MVLAKLAGVALAAFLTLTDPFSYEYSGQTKPSGEAYVTLRANQDVQDLQVTIEGDGKTIRKTIPAMGSGQTYTIEWNQSGARAKYQMEVSGDSMQGSFAFEVVKAAPGGKIGQLRVKSSREDIVQRRTATYEAPFELASYEYKVYDTDGNVITSKLVTDGVPAGQEFSFTWPAGNEVFMIWVRGEDTFGRFTEYKLVPWSVEIPHTEINFDSGKWDIKNDEVAKLDEAVAVAFHELVALEKVNEAVQANITPRLYIVGYTDTVGRASSNEKLSRGRAKAIAEYFRDQGFWAAIYYAGMGERGLRVQTEDNVDEVRNRRALYLIGVQEPAAGGQIPARWSKLSGARQRPAGFTLPPLPEKWANYKDERKQGQGGTSGGDESDMHNELPSDGSSSDTTPPAEPVSMPDMDSSDDGPPPVEGEPGASAKGCRVAPSRGAPWSSWLALAGLGLLGTRRRRL